MLLLSSFEQADRNHAATTGTTPQATVDQVLQMCSCPQSRLQQSHDLACELISDYSRPVWAVVGLSSNSERPAFSVAQTLMHHGRTVIPVNPRREAALGQAAYASLLDIPMSIRVDVVDLFVASANAGAVADEAIKRGAKAVWFQLGVSDTQVRL